MDNTEGVDLRVGDHGRRERSRPGFDLPRNCAGSTAPLVSGPLARSLACTAPRLAPSVGSWRGARPYSRPSMGTASLRKRIRLHCVSTDQGTFSQRRRTGSRPPGVGQDAAGQQPKRNGAHHLVVMNSTRSTLMEVEQIKRQPSGRPQSEAKARTEPARR